MTRDTPVRRRALLAAAAGLPLALAACGDKADSSAGGTAETVGYAADQPPVTLDFWYMPYGGPIQDRAVVQEAENFHRAHPNITINPVRIQWSDALTRLSTATTSGQGPDVTVLGTTWVGGFSALDALRPYTAAEIAAVGGPDVFATASWSASHLLGSDQITALPWLTDVRALFYRKDVLAKAGVDPATAFTDWTAFAATLKKIKAANTGVWPLAIGNANNFGIIHNVAPFIWGAGGNLLNDTGDQSRLASPAAVDGVTYYQQLVGAYDDPRAMKLESDAVPAAFANGIGAITVDNSQSVGDYLADPHRPGLRNGWGTAPLPAGKAGRFGFFGGSGLAILKAAKHPDAAFEWVRYLTSEESQRRYSVSSGLWPARSAAVKGTRLESDPAYAAFQTMIAAGRMYPSIPAWIVVESIIAKDLAELWHANAPLPRSEIQAILTKTSADIDASLKDPTQTGIK
ncbi:sugar ABC transporter substrate-binding protein [Actinoplanes ianthinogenes]|uniref:Sugar ABC transporter substrate-binding protein n=1 Tax=Actinoplanes ianthinogenes TaxID=122358 RepID=A0ABM7LU54_9ACTN|nr:extracellular solute-binding protein [Actinoplanes ianthinogenes]BCJ42777.1 sugar ABC transporter substrate-binding protein [Actinoplanes ianthinogenes]GGQ92268.1 sugar ABC transporter substrate-binding protein [Actinoplanes ianthinogenes]